MKAGETPGLKRITGSVAAWTLCGGESSPNSAEVYIKTHHRLIYPVRSCVSNVKVIFMALIISVLVKFS